MKAIEIDWSKAPEWATGYGFVGTTDVDVWVSDDCYTYVDGQQSGRVFSINHGEGWSLDEIRVVSSRPSVWNGTGLPPVGAVCEIHGTVGQELRDEKFSWRRVEIIAHTNFGGDDVSVGRDVACATLGWGIATKFRPIRTPEQIAAEERKAAVDEMRAMFKFSDAQQEMLRAVCYSLYDAGYRKTEGDK